MEDAVARFQRTEESTSVSSDHPEKHDEEEKGIEASLLPKFKRANLSSLQIPARALESSSYFLRLDSPLTPSSSSGSGGLPPRPNSVKTKSSPRSFGAKRSFPGGDMITPILPEIQPTNRCPDNQTPPRSFSLSKLLLASSTKAAHSLPTTPISNSDIDILKAKNIECHPDVPKTKAKPHIARSLSAPLNVKPRALRRLDSVGLIRVVSADPRYAGASLSQGKEIESEPAGDDIPEDEAVCRICFLELVEGGDTLKMECSCKGDLALAHKECAIKWFSIKGNKICDICKQDVENLPVTLLKLHNIRPGIRRPTITLQRTEVNRYRIWQEISVLVLVSMLAYFCFLEQLLVRDMGPRALAISLPFSCALGLLSSMTASTMASRAYIWAHACFQFAIIILFAHVYYAILNVNACLSVFLSALTGLGLVISINSLLMEYLKWRRRRQLRPANQQTGTRSWPQLQQQLYDSNYHQQHEQRLEQERYQPHSQQQAIENQNMGSSESADQEGTIQRQQLTEVPKPDLNL
uniref:RING-CH-type domain-containing protein n=1 Tax=Cucumis melo TaxID=3656 RepID=A0A9I9E0B0_CUCME